MLENAFIEIIPYFVCLESAFALLNPSFHSLAREGWNS